MSKDLYTDHDGDEVAFDDLDEAEQSYYSSDCEDDISLEEYSSNFWNSADSKEED